MNSPGCNAAEGSLHHRSTGDGSFSLWSEQFSQAFHSARGAVSEARETFINPAGLGRFSAGETLRVLELCVGTGTNTAALIEECRERHLELQWWGLELDPRPLELSLANPVFCNSWKPQTVDQLRDLQQEMVWGDARQTLAILKTELNGSCDLVMHDAFSPSVCPQLWSQEFLAASVSCLNREGRLTTYCSAAAVRRSLQELGMQLAGLPPPAGSPKHQWSGGTVASHAALKLEAPLVNFSEMELEHLCTKAAEPYRDLSGKCEAAEIQSCRAERQQHSRAESTSAWRRRWQQGEGLSNPGRFPRR